jgi:hypothetical protein
MNIGRKDNYYSIYGIFYGKSKTTFILKEDFWSEKA